MKTHGIDIQKHGVHVTKISTDGTLAGNSDDTVSTEKAIRTYVDTRKNRDVDTYGGLEAAVTAIGPTITTVKITTEQTLTGDLTIPATLELIVVKGGTIDQGAHTFTCNGQFIAGNHLVFTGSSIPIFGANALEKVLPEWFGENTTPGTTDMTAELQAAIDTVEAQAANKRAEVYLNSTHYLTSDELTVEKGGITIEGHNPNTWIISNNSTAHILRLGNGVDYLYRFTVRNLFLTKSVISSDGYAIACDYVERVIIDDVEIYGDNKVWAGMHFYKSHNVIITKTVRINNVVDRGIHIEGTNTKQCAEIRISSEVHGSGSHGIFISIYTEGIYICDDANLYGNGGNGVIIEGTVADSPKNIFIRGAIVDTSTSNGIYGEYCYRVLIQDTWVGENHGIGMAFGEHTELINIVGGASVQSWREGIALSGKNSQISNTLIESASKSNVNGYDGILVSSTAENITIESPTIFDRLDANTRWGINVDAAATNVVVNSPRLLGNFQTGLIYNGVNSIIKNPHPDTEVITAQYGNLQRWGVSQLDSSLILVVPTLPDGQYIGQIKTVVLTDNTNGGLLVISHHETENDEQATFNAVNEVGVFMWTGAHWVTIKATCTFV